MAYWGDASQFPSFAEGDPKGVVQALASPRGHHENATVGAIRSIAESISK